MATVVSDPPIKLDVENMLFVSLKTFETVFQDNRPVCLPPGGSYYSLNLQQRLQRAFPSLHRDTTIVGILQDAADEVSHLTGDALLHLPAEQFPMIL